MGVNKCAIENNLMEVTLKPDSQPVTHLWQLSLPESPGYISQYARVTRLLSSDFCMRVWLPEIRLEALSNNTSKTSKCVHKLKCLIVLNIIRKPGLNNANYIRMLCLSLVPWSSSILGIRLLAL